MAQMTFQNREITLRSLFLTVAAIAIAHCANSVIVSIMAAGILVAILDHQIRNQAYALSCQIRSLYVFSRVAREMLKRLFGTLLALLFAFYSEHILLSAIVVFFILDRLIRNEISVALITALACRMMAAYLAAWIMSSIIGIALMIAAFFVVCYEDNLHYEIETSITELISLAVDANRRQRTHVVNAILYNLHVCVPRERNPRGWLGFVYVDGLIFLFVAVITGMLYLRAIDAWQKEELGSGKLHPLPVSLNFSRL